MGGHFNFLSHWHGGDPPATLDLDTEIWKENQVFHVFLKKEKSKIYSDLGQDYYSEHFYTFFLRSIVGPTVALQAGNKNQIMFRTYPMFVLFFP